MKKNKMLIVLIAVLFLGVSWGSYVFAGDLDSPGSTDASASRMHTLEDIYKYLTDVDKAPAAKTTVTGVAASASANTLTDASLGSYANDYFNDWRIKIISGTGSGQIRTVSDFTTVTGVVTVSSNWTTNPDSTSHFELRRFFITGTADSGGNNTLTASSGLGSYSNDYFNGWTIEITGGTGNGQTKTVSDFATSTGVVTVSSNWTTNPDSTSTYSLSRPFTEPATGPTAGTMHTLDDVFENLQRLPETGQTTSYGTKQKDDGHYKSGATKRYSTYTITSNIVVVDKNTGLEWEQKTSGNKSTTYTWENAQTYCEDQIGSSGTYAGHSDWRLPNVYELLSICLLEREAISGVKASLDPYINQTVFPNTVSSYYWSSTTYPGDTGRALSVNFNLGTVYYVLKTTNYYVRCVRGGQ